ncbi:MAG: coat - 5 family protein [Bryobacterales bacterium]|nr:coat - 5 family protein [Bryobacterales bacterium]
MILTNQEISFKNLMVLENSISFTKKVVRRYDDKFGKAGAKIGYILNIRKPARSVSTAGQGIQLQDYIERSVPLVLNKQYQQACAFTSSDLALSLDDFTNRVTKPKIVQLANDIDFDGMQQFANVPAEVGTPGTVPNTADTYLNALQVLADEGFPVDEEEGLSVHISPRMQRSIFPALQGLVATASGGAQFAFLRNLAKGEGGEADYFKGLVAKGLGFDWFMTQNAPTFTTGTQGGTPTVNGAGQTGSSIVTQAWSNSTQVLNAGDIIFFAGVHRINPLTRQSTGDLRPFVVTANVVSSGAGAATIPIACVDGDGITLAGPYQTVDISPANAAAITVQGASAVQSGRGLAFHPEAFCFGCADLEMYENQHIMEMAADKELGLAIRMWAMPDINTDRLLMRLDVLGGWLTMYPQGACRVAS